MKRISFVGLFISVHLVFVIAQIHKHSQIVKLSYQKQKNEKLRDELVEKRQALTHHVYALRNPGGVKDFVQKNLSLSPITLSQVKRLDRQYDKNI